MSIIQPSGRGEQRLPDGVVVGSFPTYAEAQAAVNKISETDAEIRGLAIVGNDLKLVERIVARLTWGRVAMGGMVRGLSFGVFFALAIYLLMGEAALQSALVLPLLGAAIGIVLAIVTHSIGRRRRQFSSVQQVLASRYDVIAPQSIAGKAMHVVGQRAAAAPVTPPAEAPVAPSPEPPQA